TRRERPRGQAAEQRDEFAPLWIELHAIPHAEPGAALQDIELPAISQRVACQALTISAKSGRASQTSFLPCASVVLYDRARRDVPSCAAVAGGGGWGNELVHGRVGPPQGPVFRSGLPAFGDRQCRLSPLAPGVPDCGWTGSLRPVPLSTGSLPVERDSGPTAG